MSLGQNELELAEQYRNISDSNTQVISQLSELTETISELTDNQQSIFQNLNNVLKEESTLFNGLRTLTQTLDRTTVLVTQYLSLQTQTSLLIHSIQNCQSLISSALTRTLDPSQIPTNLLRQFLNSDLQLSLQMVQTKFVSTPNGFVLMYKIPKLTQHFVWYSIQSNPALIKGIWYEIPYKRLIINSLHESLDPEEVMRNCYSQENNYICDPTSVHVYAPDALSTSCEFYIFSLKLALNPTPEHCTLNSLAKPFTQRYIITEQKIILTSTVNDTFTYICPDITRKTPITVGYNTFSMIEDCNY